MNGSACHHSLRVSSMPYDNTKIQPQKINDDAYKATVARIEKIQSQLKDAPRGIKLKDKVCIITGVGSLKGIG